MGKCCLMNSQKNQMGLNRRQVAWRIAQEISEGSYVNLGIGSPELVQTISRKVEKLFFIVKMVS